MIAPTCGHETDKQRQLGLCKSCILESHKRLRPMLNRFRAMVASKTRPGLRLDLIARAYEPQTGRHVNVLA